MGEHTSHIYIEGIRYITVHQIPPIAGQSCLNMYAAQVWFGNPLDQWCLPPFEIPNYRNSPSTLPWDTSQHVSTDSSAECTEWSESKSKRRKIKVWPVTDVKSTIQSPWSQPNPLNCKPQVLNCNPPFAIKELGFAMKDFSCTFQGHLGTKKYMRNPELQAPIPHCKRRNWMDCYTANVFYVDLAYNLTHESLKTIENHMYLYKSCASIKIIWISQTGIQPLKKLASPYRFLIRKPPA